MLNSLGAIANFRIIDAEPPTGDEELLAWLSRQWD
jgi:hypothetical protein